MTDDNKQAQVENDELKAGSDQASAAAQAAASTSDDSATSELQSKCDEYLSGWKRALADYENLQKQNAQARDTDRRRVRSGLAEDLLPVVDNFGYVMKHVPDTSKCEPAFKKEFDTWFQGIGHIERQFAEALKNMGVEPIETVGKKFDPNLHESGGSKKDDTKDDGVVLEELIKGWKIGDVVLRPAKVIVNQKD
jgi:molecular chaperone GrpE